MADKTLANFSRGMDRQRLRATPKDGTFYNLLNCYITPSGTIKKRGGFRKVCALDPATKGLYSNDGALHAFYTGAVITPAAGVPVEYDAVQPADPTLTLSKIWADHLFIGRQYVVAEFSDGSVLHFWLPSAAADGNAPPWKANTLYNVGDSVQPTVPNGFVYVVQTSPNDNLPLWQADQEHAIGDKIQPTTRMGYYATCTNTIGTNPKSGASEPTWPAKDGALVYEDGTDAPAPTTPTTPTVPPSDPGGDRYGNAAGGSGFSAGSLTPGTTLKQH